MYCISKKNCSGVLTFLKRRFFFRLLPQNVGLLYVGSLDRPFAQIKVRAMNFMYLYLGEIVMLVARVIFMTPYKCLQCGGQ